MSDLDIRWQQRFNRYQKALRQPVGWVERSEIQHNLPCSPFSAVFHNQSWQSNFMADIVKDRESFDHVYGRIKDVLTQARAPAWQAVNAAMVSRDIGSFLSPC